ncbi:hypothetical protein CDL12_07565 [Handroanthus impetiginosus]|uniref:NAC domain-containing protein n=1 Tax=Handroanthus impetiginosus TaxID=429701 RepID=A0A2G9HQE1_9LAMI|nr:hypothetical protein CDL12_07565 [Handroanthus impetiginosus]
MESTSSSGGIHHPRLPPGFRFHPTDEELVVHYLKKKAAADPLPVAVIAEIDLYKYDPWELPSKASFGEQEWYFFSPRERKYPNGERPNRAATSGYWKATGTDKPILTAEGNRKIGVKKALVFYGGKPPKGIKTNWIMHEYRLVENSSSRNANRPPGITLRKKRSLQLDDWVLCRIFKKINSTSQPIDHESMADVPISRPISSTDPNLFPQMQSGNGWLNPHNIPMSISDPFQSSSKSYWNGVPSNRAIISSDSKQCEAEEDDYNPGGRNISFISLLNQQYYPQEFGQSYLGNHGLLPQSYSFSK